MSKNIYRVYRSPNGKVAQGLKYKILESIRTNGGSTTKDEARTNFNYSHFTIQNCFTSLLVDDFIFRVDEDYYFSPNAILVTTEKLYKVLVIKRSDFY